MDDPILTDGDRRFRGIDSYLIQLYRAVLTETSQNMRLDEISHLYAKVSAGRER